MDPVQQRDDEERWERSQRHHRFLAATCILLIAVVAALVWYSYPRFKQQAASIAQISDQIRDQIRQTADTSSAQNSLRGEAGKLGQELRARIDSVGKRASQVADDTYRKLEARLDDEIKSRTDGAVKLDARVSQIESSQAADQTQIAQLKQDLNQARQEASDRAARDSARHSADVEQVRSEVEDIRNGSTQEIAALRRDQDRNRQDVASISNKLAVEKVPFEAGKDHNTELAEGISLYVSGTDVRYRRVNGWMWVPSEHRNLWLRDQSALEPVTFYGSQDGQKRELVITNVAKNSVTGYLLLPKETNQVEPARSASGE